MAPLRLIRNLLGDMKGYSGCGICGDKWSWKREHVIMYAENMGAFPVCEECWQKAPEEKIIEASEKLAWIWVEQEWWSKEIQEKARLMVEAVKKEVKVRNIERAQP